MVCCQVNKCCCCIELPLGVRMLTLFLIFVEILGIVLSIELFPHHIFFAVPTCAVGIICNSITFFAVTFGMKKTISRWLLLPWLIYVMILVVGLVLAAILQIVIPLGSTYLHNWSMIVSLAGTCLGVGTIHLYFWIVVLELFIKMAPLNSNPLEVIPHSKTSVVQAQTFCSPDFQVFSSVPHFYQSGGPQVIIPVSRPF